MGIIVDTLDRRKKRAVNKKEKIINSISAANLPYNSLLDFLQHFKDYPIDSSSYIFYKNFKYSVIWSSFSALVYAAFIVAFNNSFFKQDNNNHLRLELFLGFVGLFVFLL